MKVGTNIHHVSEHCESFLRSKVKGQGHSEVNKALARDQISIIRCVLSDGILIKLATNIHHVIGNC